MPNAEEKPAWWHELKARYEDKIKCPCGNDRWDWFIYIGSGGDWTIACKKCGARVTNDSITE